MNNLKRQGTKAFIWGFLEDGHPWYGIHSYYFSCLITRTFRFRFDCNGDYEYCRCVSLSGTFILRRKVRSIYYSSVFYFNIAFSGFSYLINALLVNVLSSRSNSKAFLRMAIKIKSVAFQILE